MQPTIVKTSKPSDFVALVPELVGFQPENSVALVAFRGARTCGALRFTLPEPDAPPKLVQSIITTIVGMACKIRGVDALVPVLYTDDRCRDASGLPRESFARALVRRCELSGFRVPDAFCVGSDGWGSYDEPSCPPAGHPLSDISAPNFGTASRGRRGDRADERKPLGSLSSWADLPDVGLATRERLARTLRRYERLAARPDTAPELIDLVGVILDPYETAEVMLGWDPAALDVPAAAALLFIVQGPAMRDQVMLQIAFGPDVGAEVFAVNSHYAALQQATGRSLDDIIAAEHAQRGEGGGEDSPIVRASDLLMGLTSTRPDAGRIEAALVVLKAVVAMAPRSARPAPLCMLAWLSWALGRGSVAGIFIDRALAIDPRYGMATLLHTLFGSGHLPEWAYVDPAETSEL